MLSEKRTLSLSVVVAAVLVSGALVFVGFWLGGSHMKDTVKTAMGEYVAEQMAKQQQQQQPKAPTVIQGDFSGDGAVEGNKNAKVTIVEFSDFQCPYCGRFYSDAYQQIKKNYIDTGKVKLVFRNLPLSFHPGATPAALAALCAKDQGGDSMFFKFHNQLFANQSTLFQSSDIPGELKKIAVILGLDAAKFNKCLDNQQFKSSIEADSKAAAKAGISGTPSFIVGGQVISGAMPFANFKTAIDAALAK